MITEMPLCQEARLFSKFSRLFSKSVRPCQEIKVVFKVRPSESLFSNYPLPPPPLFYSRFYVGRTHMKAPRKLLKFLGVSKIYSRTTPNNTKWVLNQKFILSHSHIFETTLLHNPMLCDWIFLLQIRGKEPKNTFRTSEKFLETLSI